MFAETPPIHLFVIDDHPALHDAIRDTARYVDHLTVVGEATSADAAFAGIEETDPDVALVDLSLGDAHGLDLVKHLHGRHPDLALLVFSMFDEAVYAERAIQAGASGYLMKNAPVPELVEAIGRVHRGEVYLSEAMTSLVLRRIIGAESPDSPSLDLLTDRELEVFQLLGEGYVLRDIADTLHVSRSAVDKYRRQAMRKLGCSSVRDLLRYAITWFHQQGSRRPRPSCRPSQSEVPTS